MRFTYEGQEYALDFERSKQKVSIRAGKYKDVRKLIESTYPYTTALIMKVDNENTIRYWEVVAKAKVGCYPEDFFSLEEGRRWALRKLTPMLPKNMRSLVWDCYLNRGQTPARPAPKVQVTDVVMRDEATVESTETA